MVARSAAASAGTASDEAGTIPSGVVPAEGHERPYYSVSQVAALLGVSRVSVWRWVRAGFLPAARLGHRTVRIERGDVERFLLRAGSAQSRLPSAPGSGADSNGVHAAGDAAASLSGGPRSLDAEHVVQFYETDAFLLTTVRESIGAALRDGDAGVVIASAVHRAGLEAHLRADGIDLAAARDDGRYVSLDAAETLAQMTVDGAVDVGRFHEVAGGIVARAAAGGRRVYVFGEMVALLMAQGDHTAALRLEALWNDLRATHAFSLSCGYPMDCLGGAALAEVLGDVCAAHERIIPAESYSSLSDPGDRLRAIAVLQQKARSLELEIAERKGAEERLRVALAAERAAREAAEAALRVRDEFLSIAAHELKTPLTSLMGHAQLIQRRIERTRTSEPERVVPGLRAIAGQATKLSRLINQLLDISRLEAGRLRLERQPADLASLVEQVVAGARVRIDRHTIALDLPPSLPIEADALRLEQVLTNLLDNAVKYSPDGGAIEVIVSQPEAAAAELSVRDHGLGIPPEMRGRIFERYYQAHDKGHMSGLGLGLYISRQIVELHGGTIHAEFPSDGGTRFAVRLPVAAPKA
jgi:excisionase family DNA binding protein